jgi:signal transduction histidine kinase
LLELAQISYDEKMYVPARDYYQRYSQMVKEQDARGLLLGIHIGQDDIKNGSANFADLSLTPNFATAVQQLNGQIGTIDNRQSAPAKVDVKGKVDRYAPVTIKGALNPFNPLASLDEVIGDAQFEAESLHKCVRYRGGGEAHMHGRADLLMRAVENIVRNAIRYTPESQCVEVESQCQGGQVRISVSDHGPGVADSELDAIFQPFYRSPSNPTGTGYGLGLAIARRAVESHGGQIVARNRPEGGLRVEISLPLTPVAEPH